jgi:undecaprenyl-diphosphatase
MPLYQVIVLAIIQALTEFIPVSSSAHLELAPILFGWKDPGLAFDIALHFGTLLALLIYFFKDWVQLIAEGVGLKFGTDTELRRNPKLLWYIIIGTIPLGLAGLLFKKQAESDWRNSYLIGFMLIAVGILMWFAEKAARIRKEMGDISFTDAALIGLSQALAVVPGTSRSGITISTGLMRDLTRETAARFSFVLSAPAIAAAALKGFWDMHNHEGGIPPGMGTPFLVGIVISGVGGAVVINYFLKYLRRNSLMPFIYYRIIFGIIVIALHVFRVTAE